MNESQELVQAKEKIERLRIDVHAAWRQRAAVYVEFLNVLKEELGVEKAKELFKKATLNYGKKTAVILGLPDELEAMKNLMMAILPDDGKMFDPDIMSFTEDELVVKFKKCPLKEAWREFGLSREEVAEMCEVADNFDYGCFGTKFDYSGKGWPTQPDDSCLLIFKPKKKE